MKNISVFAELLYVVSNFEKGRVKSSGIWGKKYVRTLKNSLEIMELLTNLISADREISQDEIYVLQSFIQKNNGMFFSAKVNINALFGYNNDFVSFSDDFEDVVKLMKDIILEIKNLLCNKSKNYKIRISYLLRAFHNLPKVFFGPNDAKVFDLDIQPITKQEAIKYAFSYLSLIGNNQNAEGRLA